MRKAIKRVMVCFLLAVFFWCGMIMADRQFLREKLIRLHVVANSDSPEDQSLKLYVRDAVTESLKNDLMNISDAEQAKNYIQSKLPYIQSVAESVLKSMGCDKSVKVSFCHELFDVRSYDTVTLPSGIYHALRIVIGEGQGQNWWCVMFPDFCSIASFGDSIDAAAVSGFSEELNGALSGEEQYELRFGLLDVLGRLENMLLQG